MAAQPVGSVQAALLLPLARCLLGRIGFDAIDLEFRRLASEALKELSSRGVLQQCNSSPLVS